MPAEDIGRFFNTANLLWLEWDGIDDTDQLQIAVVLKCNEFVFGIGVPLVVTNGSITERC